MLHIHFDLKKCYLYIVSIVKHTTKVCLRMLTQIPNINNIIITKSFEYFDNADDENIVMQLDILQQVKLEYIKLLENNKNDIENQIIDMFIELDNNELNYDLEINEDDITNMFKHFEDNDNDNDNDKW